MARTLQLLGILLVTAGVLAGFCFTGFGLCLAPGWANGWPVHRNVVWPVGLSCVAFAAVMALSACVGVGARWTEDPPLPNWPLSRGWLLGSVAVSTALTAVVFVVLRARAVAAWP